MSENLSEVREAGVCRDFLRNVCTRGAKCRYLHPSRCSNPMAYHNPHQERLKFTESFCHDFQNSECRRDDCKFIHCTLEDEERFLETGHVTSSLVDDAIAKSVTPWLPGEIPVCREYLSGECRRGKLCRYRHLSICKYKKELDCIFAVPTPTIAENQESHEPKRAKQTYRLTSHTADNVYNGLLHNASTQPCVHQSPNPMVVSAPRQHPTCQIMQLTYSNDSCDVTHEPPMTLQQENAALKKEVFELRRQLSDLMTANEFLLEQNASMRLMRKNGAMLGAPTINVQPPVPPIVASVPVSIAPVSVPGSGLSLTTVAMATGTTGQQLVPVSAGHQMIPVTVAGQSQQIMSVTVAGQPTQQMIPVTMAATSGSPAIFSSAMPVSVPVSAVPVSLTMSIPPIQMSSFVQASPVERGITVNASPLVSYPIVTRQPLMPTH